MCERPPLKQRAESNHPFGAERQPRIVYAVLSPNGVIILSAWALPAPPPERTQGCARR